MQISLLRAAFSASLSSMKLMISELQTMVGNGALEIVPDIMVPDALTAEKVSLHQSEQVSWDALTAENDSLRLSLEQAGYRRQSLCLVQAGIDAKEREAADKLQKLILEELHHRIKNTLATVQAIVDPEFEDCDQYRPWPAGHRGPVSGALVARTTC